MSPRQSHARIQATITGKGKTVGPVEAHERTVLAVTRRIHTLTQKRAALAKQLKAVNDEIKFKRREFRALLQRDSTITADTADDRLTDAGRADAIDAAEARRER